MPTAWPHQMLHHGMERLAVGSTHVLLPARGQIAIPMADGQHKLCPHPISRVRQKGQPFRCCKGKSFVRDYNSFESGRARIADQCRQSGAKTFVICLKEGAKRCRSMREDAHRT